MNDIPVELEGLNDLELRLLAPRQVFIWMHPKPVSGEMYARGNLVLVPANPERSIHSLRSKMTVPCSEATAQVVKLELKRRLSDSNPYLAKTIRPDKVIKAAKALANTPLYKDLGISFDENWDLSKFETDLTEKFIAENTNEVGPHYSRKPSEEQESVASAVTRFQVVHIDRLVNIEEIDVHDSIQSLQDVIKSSFESHEITEDYYLCNPEKKIHLFSSDFSTVADLEITPGSLYHLVRSHELNNTFYWLTHSNGFSHQIFTNEDPSKSSVNDLRKSLNFFAEQHDLQDSSTYDFRRFPKNVETYKFAIADSIISTDSYDLPLHCLGLPNFSGLNCIQSDDSVHGEALFNKSNIDDAPIIIKSCEKDLPVPRKSRIESLINGLSSYHVARFDENGWLTGSIMDVAMEMLKEQYDWIDLSKSLLSTVYCAKPKRFPYNPEHVMQVHHVHPK